MANDREKKVGRGCTSYNNEYFQKTAESDYAKYGFVCKEGSEWDKYLTIQRKTSKYGTLTDKRDGKTYYTIKIGEQTWMAENLNFDYKVNGVTYGTVADLENGDVYGRRYSWSAAMDSAGVFSTTSKGCGFGIYCEVSTRARGVCPEGWHLPTQNEWESLYSAMGGSPYAMQAKGFEVWPNATDAYGFSVLPQNSRSEFWTASQRSTVLAYYWTLTADAAEIADEYKQWRYPVRCLKDPD